MLSYEQFNLKSSMARLPLSWVSTILFKHLRNLLMQPFWFRVLNQAELSSEILNNLIWFKQQRLRHNCIDIYPKYWSWKFRLYLHYNEKRSIKVNRVLTRDKGRQTQYWLISALNAKYLQNIEILETFRLNKIWIVRRTRPQTDLHYCCNPKKLFGNHKRLDNNKQKKDVSKSQKKTKLFSVHFVREFDLSKSVISNLNSHQLWLLL